MAADWFIWFNRAGEKSPSAEDLGKVLEDYLGAFAEKVWWDQDRWYAKLQGKKTWPLRRVTSGVIPDGTVEGDRMYEVMKAVADEESSEDRYIEVWRSDNCVDVMTRHGDRATNTLAAGYAGVVAKYWKGRMDD